MWSVVAAGVAALAVAAPASSATTTATVRVVTLSPFTVRGAQFEPRESVLVAVTSGRQRTERHLRASSAGAFVASFPALSVGRCGGYVVRALGSRGSVATARSPSVRCPPRP